MTWKIIYQESSVVDDTVAQVASLGSLSGPITFRIQNTKTGEIREVVAWDRDDLGQRIDAGEFNDD